MFQIIAIVIFYFRSSSGVKRKRQKTTDPCTAEGLAVAKPELTFPYVLCGFVALDGQKNIGRGRPG